MVFKPLQQERSAARGRKETGRREHTSLPAGSQLGASVRPAWRQRICKYG